jgi:hypothetical protein
MPDFSDSHCKFNAWPKKQTTGTAPGYSLDSIMHAFGPTEVETEDGIQYAGGTTIVHPMLEIGENSEYRVRFTFILDTRKIKNTKAGVYPVTAYVFNEDRTYLYDIASYSIIFKDPSALTDQTTTTTTSMTAQTTTTTQITTTVTTAESSLSEPETTTEDYTWSFNVIDDKYAMLLDYNPHYDWYVIKLWDTVNDLPLTEIGPAALKGLTGLLDIILPQTLTTIGFDAFSGCTALTKIVIPDGVTTIRDNAFSDCTALETIIIPDSVQEIGDSAFRNTAWLKAQQEQDPLVIVNQILLDGTTASGDVEIPDYVKKIKSGAFKNCTGLTKITIPDSVTEIGDDAFSGCTGLTEVIIPDSVKKIGSNAFAGCEKLIRAVLPQNLTWIPAEAFSGCKVLTDISIPAKLQYIDGGAFLGCTSLTEVTIPDTAEEIGHEAFANCTNLSLVTILNTVDSDSINIWADTFSNCPNLTIYGYEGASPEYYAKKYNLTFKVIGSDLPCKGDINGDSEVSVEDAQLALVEYVNAMTGLESSLTEKQKLAGDVNGDKEISVEDAQTILLYYVRNTLSGETVTWDDLLGKKPQGQQLPKSLALHEDIWIDADRYLTEAETS